MPSPVENSAQNPPPSTENLGRPASASAEQANGGPPSTPPESIRPKQPTIRTMRSDVEEMFQKDKPTLAQMMARGGGVAREKTGSRFHFSFSYRILAVFGIVVVSAGFIYFFPSLFPKIFPGAQKPVSREDATPPVSFFSTESVTTLIVPLDTVPFFDEIRGIVKAHDREKTIRKIIIQFAGTPPSSSRAANAGDFFNLYRIAAPSQFLERLYPDFMSFVFYGSAGGRFGFLMRTKDSARTLRDLIAWEKTLARDFDPFLFNAPVTQVPSSFEDKTYRNIDWRFLNLSKDQDLGIAYTLFPSQDYVIFTTGKEAMETVINRLFDGR